MSAHRLSIVACLAVGLLGSLPARAEQKSAAVVVTAATPQDEEVAVQVRKIAVDSMENYRSFATRRFLTDKDVKAHNDLKTLVEEGKKKVATAMRSTIFDQGVEELNQAYLAAKGLIGELEANQLAELYLGLAMAKTVMGEKPLAAEYMALYRNLVPEKGRQSVAYNKLFLDVFDPVQKRAETERKARVTITTEPPDSLIGIDGATWGKSPMEAELTPGGHLVQVESEGYYRGGWVKDPGLDGSKWTLTVKPIETRSRFLDLQKRLAALYAPESVLPADPGKEKKGKPKKGKEAAPPPPPPPPADPEELLTSLATILSADLALFIVVSTDETGGRIRLRGGFLSPYGLHAIDESIYRDAAIIESFRKAILAATDLEQQKTELATLKAEKQRTRLLAWADALGRETAAAESALDERGALWQLAGQPQKAAHFGETGAAASVLAGRIEMARQKIDAAPDETRKELDSCAGEWKQLESKVRSLMAWDIETAFRTRSIEEVRTMGAALNKGIGQARALLEEKKAKLDPQELIRVNQELALLDGDSGRLGGMLAKGPLEADTRRLLYGLMIRQAELRRRLALE
jgi:hypothetical protein